MAAEQTIASLIVKLSAQTMELSSGLKKAEGMVGTFKTAAMKLLGGISFTAIGYGLLKAISSARSYAAEMSKLAEKTNTNIETISALANAADDLGVSYDVVANAMKFISRSSAAAEEGIGKQRTAFEQMGVAYESAPGVVRPAIDILFDLADSFKRMEGDPQRNAKAMIIMGRGFLEAVPMMSKGSAGLKEMMSTAKDAGMVVDAYTGKSARAFGLAVKELKDHFEGFAITVVSDFLPAVTSAVTTLEKWAASIHSMRGAVDILVDAIKAMSIVVIPLLSIKLLAMVASISVVSAALESIAFAKAIGGFSSLGLAVINAGYIIKAFAVGTIGPMLLNPITWVLAALALLTFAWLRLTKSTEMAKIEHEKYIAAIKGMDLSTLQSQIKVYEKYLDELAAYIEKKRAEIGEGTFSLAQAGLGADLDRALKYQKSAMDALAALKEQQKKLKGVSTGAEDNAQTLEKVIAKVNEYKNALITLENPAAGARAAVKAFEDEVRRTSEVGPKTDAALKQMWSAFNTLQKAQTEKAVSLAVDKGQMQMAIATWEAYGEELQQQYDNGLLGIKEYYEQRRNIIVAQTRLEILELQKERDKSDTSPERKAAIPAEIVVKETKRDAAVKASVVDETKAWKDLWAAIREGDLSDFVARNNIEMEDLQNQFADGLIATRDFFSERRKIIQQNAQAEITAVEETIPGLDPAAAEAAANKIRAIKIQLMSDMKKIDRDEVVQVRQNTIDQLDITAKFYDLKARAADDAFSEMGASQQRDMALLKLRQSDELTAIQNSKDELILVDGEYLTKKDALEKAAALQSDERDKKTAQNQRDIFALKMQYAESFAQKSGEMFTNLYELSGKKIKAFFYLQKAAAIAEAMISTAAAAAKALDWGGPAGFAMAALVGAAGAAQIAVIMAQTIKGEGMQRGGPVTKGSGARDDVPAMLTKGEYVQPAAAVRYYGSAFMEAIRRMAVPRDQVRGFRVFPVTTPQFAFASGGLASGGSAGYQVTVPVNVYGGDKELGSKLRANIEDVVIRTLREHVR